jgi:molybdopterin synthase catalytic subunit
VQPRGDDDTWVGISDERLPIDAALSWAGTPDCGAVVLFSGNARDHSDGRPEVSDLEYEAYESQVEPRLRSLADEARARWSSVRRIVMIHRVGRVEIGEAAVIVVTAAPHRDEAFSAGRFCIDALKATVPVWKRERWRDGESWGLEAQHLVEIDQFGGGVENGRRRNDADPNASGAGR